MWCRAAAETADLEVARYAQAMHELDLPRRSHTIIVAGAFGVGSIRAEDLVGLRRLYAHLEPGGVLLIDHHLPSLERASTWNDGIAEPDLPRPFPEHGQRRTAADGTTLELRTRLVAFDPFEQTAQVEIEIGHTSDGEVLATERHRVDLGGEHPGTQPTDGPRSDTAPQPSPGASSRRALTFGCHDVAAHAHATGRTSVNDAPEPNLRRRRILIGAGAVLALLLLAGGAFVWWFLRDDAPDEVSIDAAAAQVGDTTPDGSTAGTTPPDTAAISPAGAPTTVDDRSADADGTTNAPADTSRPDHGASGTTDIAGVWGVDTSIGEFSFEDSTGTFVGFRVEEELSSIGSTTAVGRTPVVDGTLTIDGTTVTDVSIEADMTAITTDDSRRDSRVQSALDTGRFPTATFVLTSPIELGATAATGEVVSADGTGDLTIHGVTRTVTIPLEAQLVGETIVVVGSVEIEFGDFDVEVPSAPIVVSAEDRGPLELQLFFTR